MGDQAFGVAQVVGNVDQLQRVHEAEGARAAAFDVEGDHGAAAVHLAARQCILRMVGAPGVKDARNARLSGQEVGDPPRIVGLAAHPQIEGFQPLGQQPRIERAERRPGVAKERAQHVLHQRPVVGEDGAAQAAALAVDVLGGRIDDDVGPKPQGLLEDRRGEHVGDDDAGTRRVGKVGDRREVDDLERRIGGRFQEHRGGRARQRRAPLVEIGTVDELGRDAIARQQVGHDVVARAEQGAGGDDAVAGLERREKGGEDGGHAAGGAAAELGPLDEGEAAFERTQRRIGVARVDVALDVALEGAFRFLGRLVDVARGHEQRLAGFAEWRAGQSTAHQTGGFAPLGRVGFCLGHVDPPVLRPATKKARTAAVRAPRAPTF
jgi:hypothetical protein